MTDKVSAGPYALEIPPNGVAILYEMDEAGAEHQLPGGVGYFEALIQFAGEVMRLNAEIVALREERQRMSELPGCMMPDGAEPCLAYSRLREAAEALCNYYERSLMVGPGRHPTRETILWRRLRAVLRGDAGQSNP